jgi:hypothetical protein
MSKLLYAGQIETMVFGSVTDIDDHSKLCYQKQGLGYSLSTSYYSQHRFDITEMDDDI